MSEARENILKVAAELGLTMETKFIPFSQSRNKAEKSPSLNWTVSLHRSGRQFLTTDYSAGCGHAPSYKQNDSSLLQSALLELECENGRPYSYSQGSYSPRPGAGH